MREGAIQDHVIGTQIAILSFTYSSHNGIGIVMKRQAELLASKDMEVTVFCFESDIDPEEYSIRTLYIPKNDDLRRIYRVIWPVFILPLFLLWLKLRKFDTLISHKYPFNIVCYIAQISSNCRYIYYDHGVAPPSVYMGLAEKFYSKIMRKLQAYSARPADIVISISKFISEELKKEGGPGSTEIIYNSTPESVISFRSDLINIKKKHGIPEDASVLLFVGRLARHKNIHTLVQAHSLICERNNTSPYLVIVGKPTQKRYYDRIIRMSNDNVCFSGYVEDEYLASYYGQADVYVTASLWEGCNLTVLEAQEMDLPVVAFESGAHPETVEVPPGKLVQKGDVEALAESIRQVLSGK